MQNGKITNLEQFAKEMTEKNRTDTYIYGI